MKRFAFRQETLLRIRRQVRRQVEMKLMRAQAEVVRAQQERNQLELELAGLVDAPTYAAKEASAEISQSRIWQWVHASQHLQMAIKAVGERIQTLTKTRDEVRAELNHATRQVEVLESLRTRAWQSYRRDVQRQDAKTLDDIAMRNWFQLQRLTAKEHADD